MLSVRPKSMHRLPAQQPLAAAHTAAMDSYHVNVAWDLSRQSISTWLLCLTHMHSDHYADLVTVPKANKDLKSYA